MTKSFCTAALIFVVSTLSAFAQWAPVTSGTTRNLNAVQLLDSAVGYAAGDSGQIMQRTGRGGSGPAPVSATTIAFLA